MYNLFWIWQWQKFCYFFVNVHLDVFIIGLAEICHPLVEHGIHVFWFSLILINQIPFINPYAAGG